LTFVLADPPRFGIFERPSAMISPRVTGVVPGQSKPVIQKPVVQK